MQPIILTQEQKDIIDAILNEDEPVVLVDSVAGSSKSFTLRSAARLIPHNKTVKYIVFGKKNQLEAQEEFPPHVDCRTIHSFAYSNVVRQLGLKVSGFFDRRTITEHLNKEQKRSLVDLIEQWCLSDALTLDEFNSDGRIKTEMLKLVRKYFNKMSQGEIPITHNGYLKVFHLLLAHKQIEPEVLDYLMIDEAGDLNGVTIAISKLYPARKKVYVGDKNQAIFGSFMYCKNAFEEVQGKTMRLTQSFRVSEPIAERVEGFCKKYIDKDMKFSGFHYENIPTIRDVAYISRTNGMLVKLIVDDMEFGKHFRLARKPEDIFESVLAILDIFESGTTTNVRYKFLKPYAAKFREIRPEAFISYVEEEFKDPDIQTALNLIKVAGRHKIRQAYAYAVNEYGTNDDERPLYLTAHTSKGLTVDKVIICDDLNGVVEQAIEKHENGERDLHVMEELMLYYVACTRARYELKKAKHLP